MKNQVRDSEQAVMERIPHNILHPHPALPPGSPADIWIPLIMMSFSTHTDGYRSCQGLPVRLRSALTLGSPGTGRNQPGIKRIA